MATEIWDASSAMMQEDGLAGLTPEQASWLKRAQYAYEHSTDFMNAYQRAMWDRSLDLFNGEHPQNSKYRTDLYRHRSKLFRPKTRAAERRDEAATAVAFFSSNDVVSIEPQDDGDPRQRASAEFMNEIVNLRLTKDIPWFPLVVGARQVANVQGIVVSKQVWEYRTRRRRYTRPAVDPMTGMPFMDDAGNPVFEDYTQEDIVSDKPVIKLIRPENFRVHEGSDWTDPVGTSPFIIEMEAMFVGAVKRLREREYQKGTRIKWLDVPFNLYSQALVSQTAGIRQKREGYDPIDNPISPSSSNPTHDQDMVWVHTNIIQDDEGDDWVYWTLGDIALLSEPVPIEEVFFQGCRPYVVGVSNLEVFNVFPRSKVWLGRELQHEINDNVNLRLDNQKLALHPLTVVRRGADVDLKVLHSGAPGATLFLDKPGEDLSQFRPLDVTGSSYQDQDRLNADFDDLMGAFNPSSVQTSRALNETVGGMQLLAGAANSITELDLRVFTETWVERVLWQIVKLEQAYETDETLMALAGAKSQEVQRYGLDPVTDNLLDAKLTVRVNVGIGATDPATSLQKFTYALKTVLETAMGLVPVFGPGVFESEGFQNISDKVFGILGYKDGSRFLNFVTEQMRQAMAQQGDPAEAARAEAEAKAAVQLQSDQMKGQTQLAVENMKQRGETQRETMRIRADDRRAAMDRRSAAQGNAQKMFADLIGARMGNASKERLASMRPQGSA